MTGYRANNPLERSGGPRGSAGGTVLYVLMFIAATILILGLTIAWDKRPRTVKPSPEELRAAARARADSYSEEYRAARGDAYYEGQGLRPNVRVRNPRPPSPEPEVVTPAVEPNPPTPQRQFVGRLDWDRYHRPDCKYAMRTPEEERIYFTSAQDAWSKSYIPCKVCNPPLPEGNPPKPAEHVATRPEPRPRPVKPAEKPVSLPVEDVNVGFPFTMVEREDVQESGVLRVELTVEVGRPLRRPDVMVLAQKLVAAETRRRKVNAVSIFMRSKVESNTLLKWVCMVDWAPYGNLTRANEVPAGDYRTHQFNIFDQGFFKR